MQKKGVSRIFVVLSILVAILVILGVIVYSYSGKSNQKVSSSSNNRINFANLVSNSSVEEISEKFNEDFVEYILFNIGAYKLHNLPFSSDTPKINFYVGESVFNAEIQKGNTIVKRGFIDDGDIIIRTSLEEASKMVKDGNYVKKSFENGRSTLELKASKTTLFVKGYMEIYNGINGN
ncbi:MAG: hypothetical protein Q7S74_06785 [Nanoarchaeota archaeon]|nr:hypothetical protein [Nanoarchaeota archaeon]